MSERTYEITRNVCRGCGMDIDDGGLCGFDCQYDCASLTERPYDFQRVQITERVIETHGRNGAA